MMFNHILLGASPLTGDSFPTWPLLILILAALAIVTFVILKKQNKKAVTDFAQIDFETDISGTEFIEDKGSFYKNTKESYDSDTDGEYDDEYDEKNEDAYENDQRNFEMMGDDDDDDEEY